MLRERKSTYISYCVVKDTKGIGQHDVCRRGGRVGKQVKRSTRRERGGRGGSGGGG